MPKKEIPKLTARRTSEIEAILQELWHLRPDLENKSKMTIYLSLDALVRESKSVDGTSAVGEGNTTPKAAIPYQQETNGEEQSPIDEATTFPHPKEDISEDAEWGDNF